MQLRRGAHDLQKALKARRAVGKQLRKVRKLPDGVDKGRDIEPVSYTHLAGGQGADGALGPVSCRKSEGNRLLQAAL